MAVRDDDDDDNPYELVYTITLTQLRSRRVLIADMGIDSPETRG